MNMCPVQFMVLGVAGPLSDVSLPSALAQCAENKYHWVAGGGDWSVPENWEHDEWDPEWEQCAPVPGAPGVGHWAHVEMGAAYIAMSGATRHSLELDAHLDILPGGSLLCSWETVGFQSTGSIPQTGGTNSVTHDITPGHSE